MRPPRAMDGRPLRGPVWRIALVLLCLVLGSAAAASTLTEHMSIGCAQDTPTTLNCQYRLLEGGQLQAVVAEWRHHTVNARLGAAYPAGGDTNALLVLVAWAVVRLNLLNAPASAYSRFSRTTAHATSTSSAPNTGMPM